MCSHPTRRRERRQEDAADDHDGSQGESAPLSYADRVRTGDLIGPRVYSTGRGVFWTDDIDSLEKARDVLRKYAEYFDTKTLKMYSAAARQGRQQILLAAREMGLMPTTEGGLNIRRNITETLDGYPGMEHNLPIFPVYDDVVQLFAEQRRFYTPTLLVTYGGPWAENWFYENENPHDDAKLRRFLPHQVLDAASLRRGQWFHESQYAFERHAEFVRELVEAGGKAGVGSHGQLQGLGYHWELWAMQSGGLDEHEMLKVVHAARGRGHRTGERPWIRRAGQAGGPGGPGRGSSGRHPEYCPHRVGHEERPALRRRNPGGALAASARA